MLQRLSLAKQLAQLANPTPIDFDPEAAHDGEGNEDDEVHVHEGDARGHYVDVGPSDLRRTNEQSVSGAKYEGVRTSRATLARQDQDGGDEASSTSSPNSDNDSDEGEEEVTRPPPRTTSPTTTIPLRTNVTSTPTPPPPPPAAVGLAHPTETDPEPLGLRQKREEDRKKGRAVSRQLAIWDALLDVRIRMQRCVLLSRSNPSSSSAPRAALDLNLDTNDADSARAALALDEFIVQSLELENDLAEFQEAHLKANANAEDSSSPPPRKRRRTNDLERGELLVELEEAARGCVGFEGFYHPHALQTLQKWSAKIQAVSPAVLLPNSRNAFSGKDKPSSAVELIEEQLSRPPREGDGEDKKLEGEDEEDRAFYQQLLRDVIDSRTGAGADDGWIEEQKRRKAAKKARGKVDTKASKGRKVRYEVHEKLQNFMVPVAAGMGGAGSGAWHDEQVDELFGSLLGRGFANAGGTDDDDEVEGDEKGMEEAFKDGFRIFG